VSQAALEAGLGRSLMERLMSGQKALLLDQQFRMVPEISSWPARQFYDGLLQDHPSVFSRPEPTWLPAECRGAYTLLDVSHGLEKRSGTSWCNSAEVDAVIEVVQSLLSGLEGEALPLIGVVSFYSAQVRAISEGLRLQGIDGVMVRTVDSFQGSELDVCILSCVRANARGAVGFAADARRLEGC